MLIEDFEEHVNPRQQASLEARAGNSPTWTWDYYVKLLAEGGAMQAQAIIRQRFGQ